MLNDQIFLALPHRKELSRGRSASLPLPHATGTTSSTSELLVLQQQTLYCVLHNSLLEIGIPTQAFIAL